MNEPNTERGDVIVDNRLTGQEWYDKFLSELEKDSFHTFTPEEQLIADRPGGRVEVAVELMRNAVKRAAGIE